jgi:hypothetical protein
VGKWDTTILAALLYLLTFVLWIAADTPANRARVKQCWRAVATAPKDSVAARFAASCQLPNGAGV